MRILPGALLLILPFVIGCGGGGWPHLPQKMGTVSIRTVWPSGSRVIPAGTASIKVQLLNGGTVVGQTLLDPNTPAASFAEVPLGSILVRAIAYPSATGTGTPMAQAEVIQSVTANATHTVALTMSSTIDRIVVAPSTVNLALLGLLTRQLVVTAYDASNAIVLTAPTDYTYATTNSLLFNVSSSGLVTGLAVGAATVTAINRTSGKSASATVNVTLY